MNMTNLPTDGAPVPNSQSQQSHVTSFVNNSTTATIAGKVIEERQALSKALKKNKIQADN